ncbi:jacalin-like lectin [Massilia sp. DWR3-1-1]|uniref:jacalin-like lectin n=1 Tax=Massilia sp. DWR3-1-1 TaxID=2804559 RepID=UPI003CFAD24D
MNQHLAKATFSLLGACALLMTPQVRAQGMPEISPAIKKMLGGLPIAGIKDDVQTMVGALKNSSCGGGLKGCYMAKSGPLQLYFFTSNTAQQTFLLVLNQRMGMPPLLKPNVQKILGGTAISDPIISISTADFDLDAAKMPPDLRKVLKDSYFNAPGLSFASGVQMTAQASMGPIMQANMFKLGVLVKQMVIRAGVVMPIPTDLVGGAGMGVGLAGAMKDGDTMKQAGAKAMEPGAFVELALDPSARTWMTLPAMTTTDMTFFIDNELTFGYKANTRFPGVDKEILLQFQTPLDPAGAMDLLDFSFRMATPKTFTLEDAARIAIGMQMPPEMPPGQAKASLERYGGGFIGKIKDIAKPLLTAVKPLSVFQLRNPSPPLTPYRVGDPGKPFPTTDAPFNVLVLGPAADGGPLLHVAGDAHILGQTMGSMDLTIGKAGFHGTAEENIAVKLGPLGKVRIKMLAVADIGARQQNVSLVGNLAGQKLALVLSGDSLAVELSASCINPFEIKTRVTITPTLDIADIMEGQGGASVDPSKLQNCIGKDLEKALNKVANEYKSMEGFGAKNATAALKQIDDTARQAEKAATDAYNQTKNAARKSASTVSNGASHAFNDAGNAFKGIGKKKKHKKGPDPRFAASVFDWDYYYDNYPDVVKAGVDLPTHWQEHGFREGRQGAPEFSARFYRDRYLDVQQRCSATDYDCVLKHWLDEGIEEGRQGSAKVSIASYLQRYSDLQNAFGKDNFPDALDHWMNSGEGEGRDPAPATSVTGPIYGAQLLGGDGGGAWSDVTQCAGQHVTGFRLKWGDQVGAVQFQYGANGWAPMQGNGNGDWRSTVTLAAGETITRVDYRSGDRVDALTFISNKGRRFGPYGGGGGSPGTYQASAGQVLGCVAGRAGKQIDRLMFSSTGPR